MSKLMDLAQARANNTGHTHYVVRDYLTDRTVVKMNPAKVYGRDEILLIVTPDVGGRAALRKRRKTRGGNRVRVGNNVR